MGIIERSKIYTEKDLDTIFFRPMFIGENAEQLGIRVMYNMPMPTTIQMWSPNSDILKKYSTGWNGGNPAIRQQKSIDMQKLKAEVSFSASDYFQSVYEHIVGRADVNLDDLTGTELEQAETEMFRASIAESLRVLMWLGNTSAYSYNMMDGFLTRAANYVDSSDVTIYEGTGDPITADNVVELLKSLWAIARPELKALRGEGQLAYFVTTDIYDAYEEYLDNHAGDGAYVDLISGRRELSYHGIKLVDIGISQYIAGNDDYAQSYCLLTDRRNLVLAVNTSDYPGSEVRMWYNPDIMENRQRAIFMAGTEILDEQLMVWAIL